MGEGGGGKSASGSGETTAPNLCGQEAGKIGRMCSLTAYLRGMYEGDGLRGRGEYLVAVVETSGTGETYEDPVSVITPNR